MNLEGQTLTLILLSLIAPVGAIDTIYFHIWRFRLASRVDSRAETLTHIARSLVLGFVALLLALFEPAGAWFWLVTGLLGFDFVNNLVDVWLEGDSRSALGGVPRLEQLIHIAGSTVVGAASVSFVLSGWPYAGFPTALIPASMPALLKANAILVGVGAIALATLESGMLLRAHLDSPTPRAHTVD